MKENLRKSVIGGLVALVGSLPINGCTIKGYDQDQIASSKRDIRIREDYADERIRQIAIYQLFNGRRMNYKEFTDITGIERTLPEEYHNLPIWINVRGHYPEIEQKYVNSDGKNHVEFYIPLRLSGKIESTLQKRLNEYRGIKPLTDKDFENLPSGGY